MWEELNQTKGPIDRSAAISLDFTDMDISDDEPEMVEIVQERPADGNNDAFVAPIHREDAPLAGILKPELQNVDPR